MGLFSGPPPPYYNDDHSPVPDPVTPTEFCVRVIFSFFCSLLAYALITKLLFGKSCFLFGDHLNFVWPFPPLPVSTGSAKVFLDRAYYFGACCFSGGFALLTWIYFWRLHASFGTISAIFRSILEAIRLQAEIARNLLILLVLSIIFGFVASFLKSVIL